MTHALRFASGAILTALLVVAPLNFGSTRPGGAELVAFACAAAPLVWAASLVLARKASAVPLPVALAAALFILAALPWITGLANVTSIAPFTESHFARVQTRWPVGILAAAVFSPPFFLVALVAAILPLTDLARDQRWSLAFAIALTATAVLVAILALAQNHTRATGIFWRDDGRMPGAFSGTFFHHTSFGAYLNTAWPLAAALACIARRRRPVLAALAAIACLLLLAAHTAHVGRFPQLAVLLAAPVLFLGLKPKLPWPRGPRVWLAASAAAAALALVVSLGGRADSIAARWSLLLRPVSIQKIQPAEADWPALMRDDLVIAGTSHPGWFGDREVGWRAALSAIAARPLAGHGPGNWIGAASRHTDDPFVRTFYQFLQFTHHDPLQTAVEWGVPAALALWTLLLGAIVSVARLHRRPPLALAAACALAALLLQSQLDFPFQIPALALHAAVLAALCHAAANRAPASPAA